MLNSKAQMSPICRFSCFYLVFSLKKITTAAKSHFPSCIVTSLVLSAGIKIISSKILTFTNVNMFRIPLGSTSQYMGFFFCLFFFLKLHLVIPLRTEPPHYSLITSAVHCGRRWFGPLWEQPLQSWLHFLSDSSASTMDPLIHQGLHVVARAEWVHAAHGALLSSKPQLAAAAVDAAVKTCSAHAEIIAFLFLSKSSCL